MKKNEMIINEENIVKTLEKDVLNRKPQLIKLISLLNVIDDNYTISLDGSWGVGKTFFIEQLRYLYRCNDYSTYFKKEDYDQIETFKEKYIPIYYNAWENDDHDNVVESLIFNILNTFPKYKKDILNKKQDFDNIIKPALINIVEKATLGIISKDSIEQIGSFDELTKTIKTKEEQKESLYKLFDLISKNNVRILLIIDELDRCKPDFGVKVLEAIKHFYNYKNITNLVVTNNKQLSSCVEKFYGNNFDGYNYLNKMYDTVIDLKNEKEDLTKYLYIYLGFPNDSHFFREMPHLLINYFDFTLRECNTFVNMYKMTIKYINTRNDFVKQKFLLCSGLFLPIGLALKIKNIEEYDNYIKGKSKDTILKFIDYIRNDKKDVKDIQWLEEIVNVQANEKLEDKLIDYYEKVFNNSNKGIDSYPIVDAISLIGNKISFIDVDLIQ